MFYEPNARYTENDFYNNDTSQNILITVTFARLNNEEQQLFRKYLEGDEMTVEKELRWPPNRGNQTYHGTSLKNAHFDNFRLAKGVNLRKEYEKLRRTREYSIFPPYSNQETAEKTLADWEQANPDKCTRQRDDGRFFGFREVGEAHLERFTKFLFVPAVRDASEDATEGRGTIVSEIMNLVVRSTLAERKEIKEFREDTHRRYEEIFDPSRLPELQTLERQLSSTLQIYIPDSSVRLSWQKETGFDVPMPMANIQLVEDQYPSPVGHTGHGLQRAFILTMLQHLAVTESFVASKVENANVAIGIPNLIIGIEEPELYQHPNRQRHLSEVFMKLTTEGIPNIARQIQIVYSTHSPLFLDLERFEQVRVFRKEKIEKDMPKQTRISHTTFEAIARLIEKAENLPERTYTRETLRPHLRALVTPWLNEGFFAELIVIVEGIEDSAVIIGTASALGFNLEAKGISVIPCMGKTCLDRPIAIFRNLRIPVYAIWDSDYGKSEAKPEDNHRLLRLFDYDIEDWPEVVTDKFACFKTNLMDKFKEEIGKEFFDNAIATFCRDFGMVRDTRNPRVIQYVIQEAKKKGISSTTLEKVVRRIINVHEIARYHF